MYGGFGGTFLVLSKIELFESGFNTLTFIKLDRLHGSREEGERELSLPFRSTFCRVAPWPSFVNSAAAAAAHHSPPMKLLQHRPFFVGRRQKRNNPLASCELAEGPPFMTSNFFFAIFGHPAMSAQGRAVLLLIEWTIVV